MVRLFEIVSKFRKDNSSLMLDFIGEEGWVVDKVAVDTEEFTVNTIK